MHVPWSEYWDFLDAYVDLASSEGLEKLEKYLQERQPAQNTDIKGNELLVYLSKAILKAGLILKC